MSNNSPMLVTVPRFDSDKIVEEIMRHLRLADKGELQELEGDEVRLDTMVQDLEVVSNER